MAWDWLGTATTGVVGIAGIGGTLWGSLSQNRNARAMAREERQEKRKEAAYYELLLRVDEADTWAFQIVNRKWYDKPENEHVLTVADVPDMPAIRRKTIADRGVLSVNWSRRVTQIVDDIGVELEVIWRAFIQNRAAAIERLSGDPQSYDVVKLAADSNVAQQKIIELTHTIREQIASELEHKDDGKALKK
ncbi:hypothetical protein M6D93_05700 [Jatrophihabitans telluris]|uniref:Uncharacterized protein n=1 Tax=Jatrophihabitans telluris TaxID=2038343 RepID=A0ABY4R0S9_9ACTN|nr:hypothetical protein [Jatrophihabitans telluris]UQX89501.1 hypothetical protein M6D93_05700 [Jatrophihabitans telluris]